VTWTRFPADYHALFVGTYDLDSKKWIASAARKLSAETEDQIEGIYTEYSDKELENVSSEEKSDYIEKRLNDVYQEIRFALPTARFAEVKQKQIAWLKERDELASPEEKFTFTVARIKALQDLLW
jgi:uncharacterized protein YecT (DUF1311 family)